MTGKNIRPIGHQSQDRLVERLKTLADRAGGIAALARRARLNSRTVSHYFDRGSEPSASAIVALARAGGVAVGWLLEGDSSEAPPGLPPDLIDRAIRETFEILDFHELELSRDGLREAVVNVCRVAIAEGWYRADADRGVRRKARMITLEIVRRRAV
jgi:transcriptional regulator with XRE-family HTH domain